MKLSERKSAVAWLAVASNIALVAMKIVVGLLISSVAILSEAAHSGIDLLAAVIALVAVKTASRPADSAHPFGHGKAENLSAAVEAMMILGAAGWIIYEGVDKLIHPGPIDVDKWGWGAGLMLVSALANLAVSHLLFKVARQSGSVALEADGWHHRTDVYTSAGVMAALGALWLGQKFLSQSDIKTHLQWLDAGAAFFVAALLLRAVWQLSVRAARDLMDEKLPADEEAWIRQLIVDLAPAVRGFHKLRTRRSGPSRFIEFHIFVEGTMTVAESHRLSHEVARKIEAHFPGSNVTIHVEPCQGNCLHTCSETCFLTEPQRVAVRQGRQVPPGSCSPAGAQHDEGL